MKWQKFNWSVMFVRVVQEVVDLNLTLNRVNVSNLWVVRSRGQQLKIALLTMDNIQLALYSGQGSRFIC